MAAQTHDVRLNVRRKGMNMMREELIMFLSLSPVRAVCVQIGDEVFFVAESKRISSIILPSDVHGRRR